MSNLNDAITNITTILKDTPELVILRWQGMIYDESEHFVRCDKLFLYTIYYDKKSDSCIFRRIIGCQSKNNNREPQLLYPSEILYRVREGKRAGRILPASAIMQSEKTDIAGLYKKLEEGDAPYQFCQNKKGDQYLVDFLIDCSDSLTKTSDNSLLPITTDIKELVPEFYITCKPLNTSLYIRRGDVFLNTLKTYCENYENNQSPLYNFINNRLKFSEDAGMGRVAYPYSSIFGKGVIAADPEILGQWILTTKDNFTFEKAHIKVSVVGDNANDASGVV